MGPKPHYEGVYALSRALKARCLADGTSLITDEKTWTRDHFAELVSVYCEPDAPEGASVDDRFRRRSPRPRRRHP